MAKILIACPDLRSATAYSAALSLIGFEVEIVATGMDCLARARTWQPDMMVVCQDLPWGTAEGVLTVLCEDRELGPIPTLVLTDDPARTWMDLQPGWVREMLQTPVTPDELCRIVGALSIGRSRHFTRS